MERKIYITTIDNPYNPLEDFISWYMYDIQKGYFTCSKLARLANLEDNMTEEEENKELERVIDRIIEIDPLDIYKKINIGE